MLEGPLSTLCDYLYHSYRKGNVYSSGNDFWIKSGIKLSEYNRNHDLVSSKTENQIVIGIYTFCLRLLDGFGAESGFFYYDLWCKVPTSGFLYPCRLCSMHMM